MKSLKVIALIILISLYGSISVWAQMKMHSYKLFGGTSREESPSMVKTIDGGFVMAFLSYSSDIDCVGNHGMEDIVVVKVDANGEKMWSRSYGGSMVDLFHNLVTDSNGNIYVVGESSSSDGDVPPDNKGGYDRWILKLDSSGNIIWSKLYGGTGWDHGKWIGLKSNGNIVTGGKSDSNDLDVGVNYGMEDSWTLEVNSEGEIVHSVVTGTSDSDLESSGIVTSDGGFIATMRASKADGTFNGTALGYEDLHFVKGDQNLNVEWYAIHGGSQYENYAGDIIELSDGFLFVAESSSTDYDLADGGCSDAANLGGDIWVCKINLQGELVWSRCIAMDQPAGVGGGYQMVNMGRSLFTTDDGGYLVFTQSFSDGCYPWSINGYAILATKLDSLGYIVSQNQIGRFDNYITASFVPMGQGRWMAAVESFGISKNCDAFDDGYNEKDIWLVDFREFSYYKTSKPEGDTMVCVNQTPSTYFTTHPTWKADSLTWTITPSDAGVVVGKDSTVSVLWNTSFNGDAKIVAQINSECGISPPSDTLRVMVKSICTSIDNFVDDGIKAYFQPNPTGNVANLKYSLPDGLIRAKVSLVDLEGKVVYKGMVDGSVGTLQVDVSNLRGGVYQCIVEGEKARGRCRLVVL